MKTAFLAIIALLLCVSTASAQTDTCTMVANGTYQDITAFSVCKRVTNNTGQTVCAMTGVSAEQWQSFYDYPPGGVTIGSCPSGCTGYAYNGYCYHRALDGQSCDAACSALGGCNNNGTNLLMTQSHCTNVGNAFGSTWAGGTTNGGYTGCFIQTIKAASSTYIDIDTSYQLCNWSKAGQGRLCACTVGGCPLPWGGSIANGDSVTAWAQPSSCGGCWSETRTCNNGVLSGSFEHSFCWNGDCG